MARPRLVYASANDEHASLLSRLQRKVDSLALQVANGPGKAGAWVYPALTAPAVNYGLGHMPIRYRWAGNASVELEGTAGAVPDGGTLFVLPPEYRPPLIQQIKVRISPAAAGYEFVNVQPSGVVQVFGAVPASSTPLVVSLTGARFNVLPVPTP